MHIYCIGVTFYFLFLFFSFKLRTGMEQGLSITTTSSSWWMISIVWEDTEVSCLPLFLFGFLCFANNGRDATRYEGMNERKSCRCRQSSRHRSDREASVTGRPTSGRSENVTKCVRWKWKHVWWRRRYNIKEMQGRKKTYKGEKK